MVQTEGYHPTASVAECISTVLGLQGICKYEYETELNKVGTYRIPNDKEYESMGKEAIADLHQLANLVSTHVFDLITSLRQLYRLPRTKFPFWGNLKWNW
ncbi:hypothetical protein V7S43_003865 [Phytophthora oleae]|uniref:Uncharacterized protein n=1 Tax=Phytophthora oleae TaxID=2107226 RepID=A0ABD3FY43_9STRA